VRNGYGRCAATSSLAVFGTLVRRYRERDGLNGEDRVWTGARHDAYASRLACSGRAWHSASGSGGQVVVVERLAGRQVLAWRCRCGWSMAGMPPTYGHGLSERSLAKRLLVLCHRASTNEKRNSSASFRRRPAATAKRCWRAENQIQLHQSIH
jgi:hypothetical protein